MLLQIPHHGVAQVAIKPQGSLLRKFIFWSTKFTGAYFRWQMLHPWNCQEMPHICCMPGGGGLELTDILCFWAYIFGRNTGNFFHILVQDKVQWQWRRRCRDYWKTWEFSPSEAIPYSSSRSILWVLNTKDPLRQVQGIKVKHYWAGLWLVICGPVLTLSLLCFSKAFTTLSVKCS